MIFTLCILFLAGTLTKAQTVPEPQRFKLGIGFEYNHPVGHSSSTVYQNSFGPQIELRYGILDQLALTLSGSFIKANTKAVEDEYLFYQLPSIEALPAKVGLLYQFNKFYAQGSLGPAFVFKPHSTMAMTLTPAIGYMLSNFDLSLKLEKWTSPHSMEYLGLQIRYYF